MTTEPLENSTPQMTNDAALAKLRRFPAAVVVLLSLVAAGAAAFMVSRFGVTAVAKCGSDLMQPGDTCRTSSRRRRRGGTRDFETSQDLAEQMLTGQTVAAAVVVLVALAFLVMVVLRWRADVAAAPQLTGTHDLLGAAAFSTSLSTVVLFLTAAVLAVAGLLITFAAAGVGPIGLVIAALIIALTAYFVWAGRPSGTTVVQVFPPGLVILSRSRRTDVDWASAQVYTRVAQTPSNSLSWKGHKRTVDIDDDTLFAKVRRRINEVQWPIVRQEFAAGRPVDFDGVRLEDNAVVRKRRRVGLAELQSVTAEVSKESSVYKFMGGRQGIEVSTNDIANPDLLFGLLREHTRANILGR